MAMTVGEQMRKADILEEAEKGMKKEITKSRIEKLKKYMRTPSKVSKYIQQNILRAGMKQGQYAPRVSPIARRAMGYAIPNLPKDVVDPGKGYNYKNYSKVKQYRGRGRPSGSLSAKYAPYGGVYEYRKYMRALKAQQRFQQVRYRVNQRVAQQNNIEIPAQQQIQQIQQEQAQYRQQMPQQVQYQQQIPQAPRKPFGYLFTKSPPRQIRQIQPQYNRYSVQPQQYPSNEQMPVERAVKPVFKSSGGRPYPPVNRQPLQSNPNGEFYEGVDAFTGKQILKKRLPKEAWITGR